MTAHERLLEIQRAGADACHAGRGCITCPWEDGTLEFDRWTDGYWAAEREAGNLADEARRAKTLMAVYENGRASYAAGITLSTCPFQTWEPGHAAWRSGWLEEDARALEGAKECPL